MTDNTMVMPVAPSSYGGGFGMDGGGWWIVLLLLLFAGGGFNGANGSNIYPWMNQADITTSGFQNAALGNTLSAVQGGVTSGFGDVQTALCGGFAGVTASINNGFAQTEIAANSRQMANMNQIYGIQSQLAQCCCDNRLATSQTQNIVQNEGAATRLAIQNQTQEILDKLCALEIDSLRRDNENLRSQLTAANFNASQVAQTSAIISALTPTAYSAK